MYKLSFRRLTVRLRDAVVSFPMEVAAGILSFICYVVSCRVDSDSPWWWEMEAFFPMVLAVVYFCNRTCCGKWRAVYYGVLPLAVVVLAVFKESLGGFIASVAYPFLLLLTVFLFVGFKQSPDNREFSRRALRRIFNLFFAVVFGLLAQLALILTVISMEYIFNFQTNGFLGYTFAAIGYLLVPVMFLSVQKESESRPWQAPAKAVEVIFNYVLNPAILIYTLLLYLYSVSILVAWELPKGGVAYMVFAFILVAFFGRMSQLVVARPLFGWFYRFFPFFAFPLLALFWVGSVYRLQMYGFTESRVYLLVGGVLMTLSVVLMLSKRLGQFRLMVFAASAAIVLFTYIPGISAKNIGLRAQERRLVDYAVSLRLYDAASGKLSGTADFQPSDSIALNKAVELSAAYAYLREELGTEETRRRYGKNELAEKYRSVREVSPVAYFYLPREAVFDISEYGKCCLNARFDHRTDSVFYSGKRLYFDRSAHSAAYGKRFRGLEDYAVMSDTAPFVYRTDSCMVVFHSLEYDRDKDSLRISSSEVTVYWK